MKEIAISADTVVNGIDVSDKESFKSQLLQDRTRVPDRRRVIVFLKMLSLIEASVDIEAFCSSRADPANSGDVVIVYDELRS